MPTNTLSAPRPTHPRWRLRAGGALLAAAVLPGCATQQIKPARADGSYCYDTNGGLHSKRTCLAGPIPAAEVEAEARQLQPDAQRLTVLVIRQRWADAVNRVALSVDDGPPVDTVPASFVRLRLAPGAHVLRAAWPGSDGAPVLSAPLGVAGAAGTVLCVELVGSVWLWRTHYRLELSPPAQAADRVRTLRLVADRA